MIRKHVEEKLIKIIEKCREKRNGEIVRRMRNNGDNCSERE